MHRPVETHSHKYAPSDSHKYHDGAHQLIASEPLLDRLFADPILSLEQCMPSN